MKPELPPSLHRARLTVLGFCILLAILLSLDFMFRNLGGEAASLTLWLVQSLALLLMLPGLRDGRPRHYQWLCFLLQFYFINAVLKAFSPGREIFGILEAMTSVTAFCAAISFVRAHRKAQTLLKQDA